MNDDPRKDGDSVSLSAELRLDEACQRFEAAWKAGPAPRIEDHLGKATGTEHVALLKELIRLDVAYRRQPGRRFRRRTTWPASRRWMRSGWNAK